MLPTMGSKVFSATKVREREELGACVMDWLRQRSDLEAAEKTLTQSFDDAFQRLIVTLSCCERDR